MSGEWVRFQPSRAFNLTTTLEARIPTARSVKAITGDNWEGTGVLPDLLCPASDAPTDAADLLGRGQMQQGV